MKYVPLLILALAVNTRAADVNLSTTSSAAYFGSLPAGCTDFFDGCNWHRTCASVHAQTTVFCSPIVHSTGAYTVPKNWTNTQRGEEIKRLSALNADLIVEWWKGMEATQNVEAENLDLKAQIRGMREERDNPMGLPSMPSPPVRTSTGTGR